MTLDMSLIGAGVAWSALMAVVVIGLMVMVRPRAVATRGGRWRAFILLAMLCLGFVAVALLAAFAWPESLGIAGDIAPALSIVFCIYIVVLLVLLVTLIVLPTRPRRGNGERPPTAIR